MTDPKTIATYDAKAGEYAALMKTDAPDATLQAFIDLIPMGGRVLDLGCGPGAASVHMRDAGLNPDPVDASTGMIAIARDKFKLDARIGTFDQISGTGIYDGVWANFSLLHAPREKLPAYLGNLTTAMKQGGVFHIGMKTGNGIKRDAIERLYTFVTVDELGGLLTDAGLTVIFHKEGVEKGLAGTMDPFVIMRARKNG
jgi:predicted TPR repeat methyltransferase